MKGVKTVEGSNGATCEIRIDVKRCDPSILETLKAKGVELKESYENRKFTRRLQKAMEQVRRGEVVEISYEELCRRLS